MGFTKQPTKRARAEKPEVGPDGEIVLAPGETLEGYVDGYERETADKTRFMNEWRAWLNGEYKPPESKEKRKAAARLPPGRAVQARFASCGDGAQQALATALTPAKPLKLSLSDIGDLTATTRVITTVERELQLGDASAVAALLLGLEAELAKVYVDGAIKLWPENVSQGSEFRSAQQRSGMIMRGGTLDNNTQAIWYNAGFKWYFLLTQAITLLQPFNARAFDYNDKIRDAAIKLADFVGLHNWQNKAPTGTGVVCKHLHFLQSDAIDAESTKHSDGDASTGNERAGISFSAAGVGASTGELCLHTYKSDGTLCRHSLAQPLLHATAWGMSAALRGKSLDFVHNRLKRGTQTVNSCVVMAEGPPGFLPRLLTALPLMLEVLIMEKWAPQKSPDYSKLRGWWSDPFTGASGGITSHRDEGAQFAKIVTKFVTDKEAVLGRCINLCKGKKSSGRCSGCGGWRQVTGAEALEKTTEELAQFLGFTDNSILLEKLTQAGIYETRNDKKFHDKTVGKVTGRPKSLWAKK
ncbi:hypothetical protein TeGR_g9697 [Tetraparma gracilis]|uniref:Nucleocapsid protein n=1 Tax=Tetraparma gracilis TaxID=2962635 RepID=A0ABQ6MTJ2_9STRA|nr:hypothetical protein TeGR_g9697 [Tetraparma gracilis]